MGSRSIARLVTASVIILGLVVLSAPTFAQTTGMVKGKVVDAQGQPLEGAVVTITSKAGNRKFTTKTNRRGEFIQIGLAVGDYTVLSEQGGMSQQYDVRVRIGMGPDVNFQLAPGMKAGGVEMSADQIKQQAALKASLDAAVAASTAGDHDTAIAKFNEAIVARPDCASCYHGIGISYSAKKDYAQAETALKKALELKPDFPEVYSQLATIYNAQRKFAEAEAAGAEAAKLSGAAGGGGGADVLYNQGVILWNGGKIAEAKKLFEQAIANDPNYADAHYQLGMAHLNEGKMPEATAAFEKYMSLAPTGQFAAQAKGILDTLKK